MLKKQYHIRNKFSYHIIVQHFLKGKVLTVAHVSHFGITKTNEFLSSRFFWRGMYIDTLNFGFSCTEYLQTKHHHTPPTSLQPTYTPRHAGHIISTNLVGPFINGQFVLAVIDHLSHHLELYALKDTSAPKIVKYLFNCIINNEKFFEQINL